MTDIICERAFIRNRPLDPFNRLITLPCVYIDKTFHVCIAHAIEVMDAIDEKIQNANDVKKTVNHDALVSLSSSDTTSSLLRLNANSIYPVICFIFCFALAN